MKNMPTIFEQKVYDLTAKIPKGKVTTYGIIARKLYSSPRAVGQALRKNPFWPDIPCHRVVKSDGSVGGFGGTVKGKKVKEKIDILAKEGMLIENGKILGFSQHLTSLNFR